MNDWVFYGVLGATGTWTAIADEALWKRALLALLIIICISILSEID